MTAKYKPASKKQAMFLQSNADVIVFGGSAGCLRADAEYLSPNGWVSISNYDGGKVAQYDSNTDTLEFVQPEDYIKLPQESFRRMRAKGLDFILSEEHKVPYWTERNQTPKILTWSDVLKRHDRAVKGFSGKIKTSFKYNGDGIDLNEGELRLQIAVQADGRIVNGGANNYTEMRFAKKRKYERLKWILDTWNLPYKDNGRKDCEKYSTKESFEIIVYPKYADKTFDSKYYKASKEQLEIIRDEVGHWDGTIYKTGLIRYSTTNKKNADFIQFVFHSLGYNSSYTVDKTNGNRSECYQVDCVIKGNGFRSFVGKGYKQEVEVVPSLDGFKYCFTMPKGMFLARQNNKVFITHNSGKTFVSLMRFMRWTHDPHLHAYVFRKNATDMKGGGGAFDEAVNMFTDYIKGTEYTKSPMQIKFPHPSGDKRRTGASISFIGMDGGAGKQAIQGKQISCAMVDEATHLSLDEVEWIISRLRSQVKELDGTPMKPSLWLTCNPDPDSFIYDWIAPYYLYPKGTIIDGELVEGRPIPERNGDVRYFLNMDDKYVWGETYEELFNKYKNLFGYDENGESECRPQSFQFIGATVHDNPPLKKANPLYVSKLMSLGRIEKERLLFGNWEAREEGSGYFKRDWVKIADIKELTKDDPIVKRARAWDLASTLPSEAYPDPDYTAGVLVARTLSGKYIIEDVIHGRWRQGELENMLIEQSKKDYDCYGKSGITVYLPQDPSATGKMVRGNFAKMFASHGMPVRFIKVGSKNSKLDRFLPFASASENELVYVKMDKSWNDTYLTELERFEGARNKWHDDQVDATSDGFNVLATTKELPKIKGSKLRMS